MENSVPGMSLSIVCGMPTQRTLVSSHSRRATPLVSSPPMVISASMPRVSQRGLDALRSPPSILNGLVRLVPSIVPPRGRMPADVALADRAADVVNHAAPAGLEAEHRVPADVRAAHDRADRAVDRRAVPAACQDSDVHFILQVAPLTGAKLASMAEIPA